MFELADLWEIGDDAGAYTAFLEILFTRVAEPASQSAIRKAISTRHPKPADLANDAQLIRWAIDHVDFRYRALSNVPRAEMGSNGRTMRINANGTRTLTTTVAPKRNSNADLETFENFAKMEVGVSSLQTGGDQGRNKTQSRALTRLEAFLADDMEYAMGEFTETDDIIASAGAASERFAQVMQQARTATSMSVLDITFADSGTTAPKANLVRATFEESATGRRQRADDAVNLPADVADSVNRVTWEILADTGFVDVVAGNGMLVRVRQVWNDADADPTS